MSARDSFFVDSNVLLYLLSGGEPAKQTACRDWTLALWEAEAGRLSWQVLHEFYSNAVGKLRIEPRLARYMAVRFAQWHPQAPGLDALQRAWHWCDTAHINFWDALIVASAEQAGCRWLISEDFQAGKRFGKLMVVNPFERPPGEFGLT
jgi:predicted nucleic acid-binding protein